MIGTYLQNGLMSTLLAVLAATPCFAQDEKKKQEAPPKAVAKTSDARATYDAMLSEWKGRIKKLRDLRIEFSTTTDKAKVAEIEATFKKQVAEIELMIPELIHSAEVAYNEAPNADPQLASFLGKYVEDAFKRDEMENIFRVGDLLISNEADQKNLYDMTGYAALSLNEFDKAKSYLEKAASLGKISPAGQEALATLETVRKNWEEEAPLRAKQADDMVTKEKQLPLVQLQTSKGEIVLELFEEEAPETVGNFISLVESGFYKDQKFHRVLPHFMVQGGCPKGDGSGGPGYNIYCEVDRDKPGYRKHFRGTLAMAKQQPRDTGGSQFYMCLRPTPHLDGIHTVFGRVVKGLDVLSAIERTSSEDPEDKDYKPGELTTLVDAKVIRKRDHEYKPNKVQ